MHTCVVLNRTSEDATASLPKCYLLLKEWKLFQKSRTTCHCRDVHSCPSAWRRRFQYNS